MADALLAQDILDGAAVRDRPNLFVIGSFDRRITFYSQQVRALSLIHALKELGYLHANPRIAVVGGGAAGVTAAAAAALVTGSQVVLFESADALLPLQSTTNRRRLDPHIYDWPAHYTTDPIADLPILDWESGTCRAVRDDVLLGFEDIVVRLAPRLERRLRHQVTALIRTTDGYQLDITDLNAPPPSPGAELREQFHVVFLAVGFGLEPGEPVPAIQSASYWTDAGVPVAEFAGRPTPRFFVSGAGDGGLIDFVAAGARDFDHAGMIRLISEHPGVAALKPILAAIDVCARAEDAKGARFDFIGAYDAKLLQPLVNSGLVAAVSQQLRPGVQLTFQTQHAELFDVSTATLNRLAAYLTIKACAGDAQRSFRHLHCSVVARIDAPNPAPVVAPFWLDCDGETVAADAVIIRRGPQRDLVRAPFAPHLASFDVTHKEWLARHGEATLVPKLSGPARSLFREAARSANVLAPRLQRLAANQLPISVQLLREGPNIRWSGAIQAEQLIRSWSEQQPFEIILPDGPEALGVVAGAVLRVACHSSNCRLHAAPGIWGQLVRELSLESPHAEGMAMPEIIAGNPGGAAQGPVSLPPDILSRRIHRSLDSWLLQRLDAHLQPFFASNADPGRPINVKFAQDLRREMASTWAIWHASFTDDAALLNHFLRLMICAVDDDDHRDVAQILVGPSKWPVILRGTAVALAIAAAWNATSPKSARPGNLIRLRDGDSEWAGHGCAADMINGDEMSLCAANFMWNTQFVILVVKSAIEVSRIAQRPFAQIDTDQPGLRDTDGSGPVIMSISRAFIDAAAASLAELRALLATVEAQHFEALEKTIMKGAA
ncbi:NAD(P)-binding protein [Belnapia sp. T6]|uniref:NAD(P)-binding protein n=1 Tax=Belnapia mucosa TaxID=2804532 RepID=A0ABS1VB29_9PROT|nr:ABC-three component system protein [Belnapia mucosa]MBL6458847.1 NAD(P)-binding protein [Belnapia mucosa]